MKGERFYKIVIALLVVINISSLAFMWFGRPPHPPPPPGQRHLSETLGLSGDAAAKVNALEEAHHEAKHKLVDRDMELHKKMYELIGSDEDSKTVLNQIHSNKEKIEEMTFDFFNKVAEHCNNEQKDKLREFVHTAFDQLRPPPPHR